MVYSIRIILFLVLTLIISSATTFAWPALTGSGIDPQKTWVHDSNHPDSTWLKVWIQVPRAEVLDRYGTGAYYYKAKYIRPDGSILIDYGPYGFDEQGYGKMQLQPDYAFTNGVQNRQDQMFGVWIIQFIIWEKATNTEVVVKEFPITIVNGVSR